MQGIDTVNGAEAQRMQRFAGPNRTVTGSKLSQGKANCLKAFSAGSFPSYIKLIVLFKLIV